MPSWNPAARWNARRGTAAITHPPSAPRARRRGRPPGPPLKSAAANADGGGAKPACPNPLPPPLRLAARPTRPGVPGRLTESRALTRCSSRRASPSASRSNAERVGVAGELLGARASEAASSLPAEAEASARSDAPSAEGAGETEAARAASASRAAAATAASAATPSGDGFRVSPAAATWSCPERLEVDVRTRKPGEEVFAGDDAFSGGGIGAVSAASVSRGSRSRSRVDGACAGEILAAGYSPSLLSSPSSPRRFSAASASATPRRLIPAGDAAADPFTTGRNESSTASLASSFAASAAALLAAAAASAAALTSWSSPNGFRLGSGSRPPRPAPPAALPALRGDSGCVRDPAVPPGAPPVCTATCACSLPSSTSKSEFSATPRSRITVAPPPSKNEDENASAPSSVPTNSPTATAPETSTASSSSRTRPRNTSSPAAMCTSRMCSNASFAITSGARHRHTSHDASAARADAKPSEGRASGGSSNAPSSMNRSPSSMNPKYPEESGFLFLLLCLPCAPRTEPSEPKPAPPSPSCGAPPKPSPAAGRSRDVLLFARRPAAPPGENTFSFSLHSRHRLTAWRSRLG